MILTFNQQFILVFAALVFGIVLISFLLLKFFGNGMVYKMWLRIFPAISAVIVMVYFFAGTNLGSNPFIFAVTSLVDVAVMLGFFIYTGKYFERYIINNLDKVRLSADEVTGASAVIADTGQQLAENSSQQAASIEETSASIEEMASSIKQNADYTHQANTVAMSSRNTIVAAKDKMNSMKESISDINKQSAEMAKIIKTIDEIAFQTNLLALNAAVEAARAGEAGAGFAVVADEVRNLAMRSAEAAKYTTGLIGNVQQSVTKGVKETDEIMEVFEKIGNDSEITVKLVAAVTTASAEQAKGVDQINIAVSQMDTVTQKTAVHAEDTASSAEELSAQAVELNKLIESLALFVSGKKSRQYLETPG